MKKSDNAADWQPGCPIATNTTNGCIRLQHGDGGRLTRKLISERIVATLENEYLHSMADSAHLPAVNGQLAMTTDSYVVTPLFFPGGDIGSLAVYGTVNDLAVSGARPLYLTLGLIVEEGLPLATLDRVLKSIAEAAQRTDVQIVAGDTKVVPRGAADLLFINTAGVGNVMTPTPSGTSGLRPGDELIVTGPVGCHGAAVLCAREELALQPLPTSDSAPLTEVAESLRCRLGSRVHAMRDATRGGVAAVLHEWAGASNLTMSISENDIPVTAAVRGVCELLGLDPIHLANEGTMVIAVEAGGSHDAIKAIRHLPVATRAAQIGVIQSRQIVPVTISRFLGNAQPLDDPLGAPLPRIC